MCHMSSCYPLQELVTSVDRQHSASTLTHQLLQRGASLPIGSESVARAAGKKSKIDLAGPVFEHRGLHAEDVEVVHLLAADDLRRGLA